MPVGGVPLFRGYTPPDILAEFWIPLGVAGQKKKPPGVRGLGGGRLRYQASIQAARIRSKATASRRP